MGRRSDHTREELRQLLLDAARDSLREDGVAGLSSRKIAKRAGYTVGTVFQVFGNMDRLMAEVNIATLAALYEPIAAVPADQPTEARLRGLAEAFLDFARAHPAEWDAVISYQYATDQTASEDYKERIGALLQVIGAATRDLYAADETERHQWDVRILWTSLYGVFVLSAAGRLTEGYDAAKMVDGLIDLYLAARRGGGEGANS